MCRAAILGCSRLACTLISRRKRSASSGCIGEIGKQHLHGFDAVRNDIADLVHLAHAAGAEDADDLVVADGGTNFEIHDGCLLRVGDGVADFGGPAPLNLPTADASSTSVILMAPTASSMTRITLPVAGSLTSRTLRLTASVSPTLTPSLEPTLMMRVPSGAASATRPSIVTALTGAVGSERGLLIQAVGHVGSGLIDRRAQDGVGEIGALHIERAARHAAVAAAGAEDAGAVARLFAVALDAGQNLRRGGIDHARRDRCRRRWIWTSSTPPMSEAAERAGCGAAADVGALIVAAELGDAADDDGVDAEDACDFGGAGGVGAVAVGEVLLGEDLVELLALDHRIGAVVDQLVDQNVGDALADILVGAEECGDAALHGGVIEIHHGDALLLLLCRCAG